MFILQARILWEKNNSGQGEGKLLTRIHCPSILTEVDTVRVKDKDRRSNNSISG